MAQCMLTTLDNVFNPFDDFGSWFMYDVEQGYNTCQYLARIAQFTDDMTDQEIERETERAIDEIIENDVLHVYIKIWNHDESDRLGA